MKQYLKFFLYIMMAFLSAGQSFAQEEMRVVSPSVFTVPLALTQESEIRNTDIEITYDPAVIEIAEIGLIGGIFENQKDYIQEHRILGEGRFGVVIYSTGNLIRAKGDALFLKFSVIGKEGDRSSLTLSKFDVNDSPAEGGFRINDSFSRSLGFLVNQPPIAESGALSTDEDTEASGMLTAGDKDSDPLTFRIVGDAAKGKVEITNAGTGEYIYKPGADENGNDTFTYRVNDGFSDSDTASVTITINPANDSPKFTSMPNIPAEQNSLYVYSITISDSDADDILSVTAPILPAWLTFTDNGNGTAILAGTPDNGQVGDHPVTLRVTDKAGASAEQFFTIHVADINDPPSFISTPDTKVKQNSLYTYSIATADIDLGDFRTVTAPTLPNWLILRDNGNGTASLVGKPENEHVGNHAVVLEVKDVVGLTAVQSFTVSVRNINDAPIFSTTPNTEAEEDSLYSYSMVASDKDIGDTLSITARKLPPWLSLTDKGNGSAILSGIPADEHLGNNEVILEVRDAADSAVTQAFTIVVKNINDAPLIVGHKPLTMPENSSMTLTRGGLIVEDPDNLFPEDFILTVYDGENYTREGNKISPASDFEGIIFAPVMVNDGEDESNIFPVEITVTRVNNLPVASAQTLTCLEDTEVLITLTGADPDEDLLFYSISTLPKNGSLYLTADGIVRGEKISETPRLLASPRVIYVPVPDSNGEAYGDFGFRAGDGDDRSDEATVTVNITPVNDAPVLHHERQANLSDINENDFATSGDAVSALVSGMITDPDIGSENAVAVIEADNNSGGIWQYALPGADWQNFGDTLDQSQARLLGKDAKVRFVPNKDWSGTASFTFRAWDRTFGKEGETATISETGGSTAFSSNTNTAVIVVHALPASGLKAENDSPTLVTTETHFTASAEIGSHISYTWDFGDETSGEGLSVSHIYSDLGLYSASVTAQNSVSTVRTSTFVIVCADSLTVSNEGDTGPGSLRYAVENICENGSITFNLSRDSVIVVNSPLLLNKNMSIRNQSAPNLIVSGNKKKRIFEIAPDIAVEMEGLTISNGYAQDGLGGGIYNQGSLTLTDCTLSGNSADAGRGAIDIAGNKGFGAGAVFNTGIMTLIQCTLSGNTVRAGSDIREGVVSGGIFNSREVRMSHCTLSANIAERISAKGVGALCNFIGNVSIEHSLIAGNTGTEGADVYGAFVSEGYNLIGDITGGQGFSEDKGDLTGTKGNPIDPMLGALADNGGFTRTQALLTGSPAIDAGNRYSEIPLAFDQRGKDAFPRIHDGDKDGDARIDIGAYEFSFGFISSPTTHISKGEEYRYVIITTGTGLLKDRVVAAATPLPDWLALKENQDGTVSLSGMPTDKDVGEHRVELQLENIADSMTEFQTFNITVVNVNIAPHIVGQKDLQIKAETSLTVTLNDLSIEDTDNTFPDDFSLKVGDGDNYSREDNSISPNPGFTGKLKIPVTVDDGKNDSEVFILSVSVTAIQKNIPPQITGQNDLQTTEETSLTITLNDLSVEDPDSDPNDFTLKVGDGDNYSYDGNTITPISGFTGMLKIPVTVNDGTDDSEVFILSVSVTAIQKNIRPQIIAQNDLQTKKEASLTIRLNDLSIEDPDSSFPNDFTLEIGAGDNYSYEGNTIRPNPGFIGMLKIPVTVNDGKNDSEVFILSVAVILNSAPEISGQKNLVTEVERPVIVTLNDLSIKDPDNMFPNDFVLKAGDGDNYIRKSNTITPNPGFIGALDIPLTVNDGTDESGVFILRISVIEPENTQIISGTLHFPENTLSGETARITAFSALKNSGSDVQIIYEGVSEVPYAINGLANADDYIVSAESDSYMKQYYNGDEKGGENREEAGFVSTGSPEAERIRFVLEPGLSVSGKIIDADSGAGVESVPVEAWSDSTNSGKVVFSSRDGSYTVKGLKPAADFKITAWKNYVAPFFYNNEKTVRDRKEASPVSLENGNRENIVIELREEKNIRGTIYNQAGKAIPMIWVYVTSESRNTGHGVFSAEDGTYLIAGLPVADDYKISVQPDPSASYTAEEKENVSMDSETDFILKSTETYQISGTVTDEYGNAVSTVDVEILSNSGQFYTWNQNRPAFGNEDIYGYELRGIPPGDDYVITARPPEDSAYSVFSKDNISIHGDAEINIILTPGLKIGGRVSDGRNTAIQGVRVIAVSKEKHFEGKAVTDKDGFYEIPHAPDASDYLLTAHSEYYMIQEKQISSPDKDIDFILEPSAALKGEVKSRETGQVVADAWVEAYSEQFGTMPDFSASVKTDKNGRYEIKGLKPYQDGNAIEDYTVAVYSGRYAPQSVSGKRADDVVNFLLETGRDNKLSGTVTDSDGRPQGGIVLDIFVKDGNFVESVTTENDGSFSVENLSPEIQYQLRFTNEDTMQVQWAGEGDIGFDDPDPDGDINPENAKAYNAGAKLDFKFSDSSSARSSSRLGTLRSTRGESRVRDLRASPSESLFNTPNITVIWESPEDVSKENYYYVFNKDSDYGITKRNVPRIRPLTARRATSTDIIADDISYYCHVAPVDERGRIGETEQVIFRVDTVPPFCANVSIAEKVSDQYVTLKPGAGGASEMYISNTGYGEDGKWERWLNLLEWNLTQGQGQKNIYVLFRDRAGNTARALGTTEKTATSTGQYKIIAGSGINGKISPAGYAPVKEGEDKTFSLLPDYGYETDKLFINGESVLTSGDSYTFCNINEDASIAVTFKAKTTLTYTITAGCGPNGTISPSGEVGVAQGENMTFSITPDPGYETDKVLMDGKEVRLGDDSDFTFINVSRNYALYVTFKAKGLQ